MRISPGIVLQDWYILKLIIKNKYRILLLQKYSLRFFALVSVITNQLITLSENSKKRKKLSKDVTLGTLDC